MVIDHRRLARGLRNSLRYASEKHWRQITAQLKRIWVRLDSWSDGSLVVRLAA